MGVFIGFLILIAIAIVLLKGFDKIAGRGPKQISDGIERARGSAPVEPERIPCPYCTERILPAARKCPFCKSDLNAAEAETDDALMNRYGITFDGEKYRFENYSYGRLVDAVNYAKLQASQPAHS